MGSEKVVFLVIFIHPFENSGGYFFRGRLFWWILDINLQNFVRGYFSKFSLRALLSPFWDEHLLGLHSAECMIHIKNILHKDWRRWFKFWFCLIHFFLFRWLELRCKSEIMNVLPQFSKGGSWEGRTRAKRDMRERIKLQKHEITRPLKMKMD